MIKIIMEQIFDKIYLLSENPDNIKLPNKNIKYETIKSLKKDNGIIKKIMKSESVLKYPTCYQCFKIKCNCVSNNLTHKSVAKFLTILKLFRNIVDQNIKTILILYEEVELIDNFEEVFSLCFSEEKFKEKNIDIQRPYLIKCSSENELEKNVSTYDLLTDKKTSCCYSFNIEFCKLFLDNFNSVTTEIDLLIDQISLLDCQTYSIIPSPIKHTIITNNLRINPQNYDILTHYLIEIYTPSKTDQVLFKKYFTNGLSNKAKDTISTKINKINYFENCIENFSIDKCFKTTRACLLFYNDFNTEISVKKTSIHFNYNYKIVPIRNIFIHLLNLIEDYDYNVNELKREKDMWLNFVNNKDTEPNVIFIEKFINDPNYYNSILKKFNKRVSKDINSYDSESEFKDKLFLLSKNQFNYIISLIYNKDLIELNKEKFNLSDSFVSFIKNLEL